MAAQSNCGFIHQHAGAARPRLELIRDDILQHSENMIWNSTPNWFRKQEVLLLAASPGCMPSQTCASLRKNGPEEYT